MCSGMHDRNRCNSYLCRWAVSGHMRRRRQGAELEDVCGETLGREERNSSRTKREQIRRPQGNQIHRKTHILQQIGEIVLQPLQVVRDTGFCTR